MDENRRDLDRTDTDSMEDLRPDPPFPGSEPESGAAGSEQVCWQV